MDRKFETQVIDILSAVEEANPEYLKALLEAAAIIPGRRKKYSGATDPFTNFMLAADILGIPVEDVFMHYIGLKLARLRVSTETFEDESPLDTLYDLANYALLMAAWLRRKTDAVTHRTVAIDFDGVFNTYSGWTGQFADYEPLPGIEDFLKKLRGLGYNILIYSVRKAAYIDEWLRKYNLREYISFITNEKLPAAVYVDDRGLKFNGDFEETLEQIKRYKAHWQHYKNGGTDLYSGSTMDE